MIQINKTGNAIVVDFTDNDKYLNNGTIEVAPNELMVVIDDSNMATFKKMSNGDTLFGLLIDLIQIQGENVTKDNIIEKFGAIGFSISSEAVSSVNGQTGDVVITADSLNVYTKSETDEKFATNVELNQVLSEYATNVELNHVKAELATKADTSSLNDYALKSELTGLATKEELANYQPIGDYATTTQLNSKQDTLVSGTNIKTINGQSVIGEGNIEIQLPIASADTLGGVKVGTGLSINPESGVLSADSPEWNNISGKPDDIVNITERLASKLDTATYNSEKANFATKEELNTKIGDIDIILDSLNGEVA